MSGLEFRQPTALSESNGGPSARRAMVRWAWRLFRREWHQQLLVLALISVAVAASILGAAVGTNTPPPANAGFGTANYLVTLSGSDPHLAKELAAIRAHFGDLDVIENQKIDTGLVGGSQLRSQAPGGPFGRSMLTLVSGRFPHGDDQVAVTSQLASTLNLRVGGTWREGALARRVVGVVENPQNLLDQFALVAAGQISSPTQVTVLFDATPTEVADFNFPVGVVPVTPQHSNGISPTVIVLVLAIFGLIFVGLVAVAGFTVLAQRRLRALGMLSTLGATDRNVRLVMEANGFVVGVVGSLVGAILGLGAWITYAPHLSVSAHHQVQWFNLPWWLIVTTLALGVVTATVASRRPARALSQIPVMAALSGRPVAVTFIHRSARPGIILLVLGLALLVFSGGYGGGNPPFLLGGVIASAGGLLLLASPAIGVLSIVAPHSPIAIRIALRDLIRYRARSGAALAATSLAVLMAMLIALVATGRYSDVLDYFGPNLSSNQLVIYAPGHEPGEGIPSTTNSPSQKKLFQSRVATITSFLDTHNVLRLETTNVVLVRTTKGSNFSGQIYVATPALLHHYGITSSEIDRHSDILTSRVGLDSVGDLDLASQHDFLTATCRRTSCTKDPKIQTLVNLPTDVSDPNVVITEYAIHRLGLRGGQTSAWLVQNQQPFTSLQINTVRQDAVVAGMTIETRNEDPSLGDLRNYATGAGILLALGILAMTVGLIRGETTGDIRTLSAIGASSGTRRTLTGTTAGSIGLLGAVLGTLVAYLAAAAYSGSQLSQRMSHVPVLDLSLILVGLPVFAGAGGWLFAGREVRAISRQSME